MPLLGSFLPSLLGIGKGLQLLETRRGRGKNLRKGIKNTRNLKPLTNIEIKSIINNNNIGNFRGVFSKDMLPSKIDNDESCVINIQDCYDGT